MPTVLFRKTWRFAFDTLRARFVFRGVQSLGSGVRISGHAPIVRNLHGLIELGDHVFFEAPVTPAFMQVALGAFLRIGDDSYINDAVWIGVTERVTIGARVRIGPGVRIIDNTYHELDDRGARPGASPVVIEDDVWIASDSMINPGVHLGRGAVVGAHSLVTKSVAPFAVVAGVPARQISEVNRAAFERARERKGGRLPTARERMEESY
jgi:acetyltransferase-like isoleucine patch superfamily enzyme